MLRDTKTKESTVQSPDTEPLLKEAEYLGKDVFSFLRIVGDIGVEDLI